MTPGGLIAFTLRRRITVLMMAAAVVLVGLITYFLLPLQLAPKGFTEDEVSMWIPVPASNPAEIQEQVIRPAEELIRTVPSISRISTRARSNSASIHVRFSREVDVDLAVAELRDRMERARAKWPEDVRDYRIFRFNLDTDLPIVSFAIDLTHGYSDEIAFLVEENVIKRVESLPGVARVQCMGLLQNQIRIFVDREKAQSLGVSIYALTQTLSKSNIELSGGEMEDGETRYALRTDARFRDLDDIRNFPVNADGLRLSEIARVESVKAVRDRMALSRNRRSLWCQVTKEASANAVDTSARVRKFIQELKQDRRIKELGGSVRQYDRFDVGLLINGSLVTVRKTALMGGMFAMLVLFWFLRRLSTTLIITTSIPLSLLVTAAWLYFSGGSMNILSMLGITVSIGMLIDNSIVVVENISRQRDLGFPPLEAARRGASEVALAITLSTLTTVAAFLPIIFMTGNAQMTFFTSAIGLPLCVAVMSSLFVALVFIPLATVVFDRFSSTGQPGQKRSRWRRSFVLEVARGLYAGTLRRALGNRLLAVLTVVTVVGGLTAAAWETLPKVDVMSDQGGSLEIRMKFDKNFSLRDAYDEMLFLGKWLDERAVEYDVEHFWCFFSKRSGNFWVILDHKDMVRTRELAKQLDRELPPRPGVKISLRINDGGDEEKGKLLLDIHGPDPAELLRLSKEVAELLEPVPGVLAVTSDLEEGEEEIHVIPSREQSARYDIDPRALRGTLQYGIRGWRFSDLVMGEREIPLIIEYEGSETRNLPQLKELPIPTGTGGLIPLSSVADVRVSRGFGEIRRTNGQVRARLTLETASDDRTVVAAGIRDRLQTYSLPDGYSFRQTRQDDMDQAMKEMRGAVLLAVVFVFLLMGILFESFILPLAVLVAVPFSWAGLVWGLALTSTPLDFVGSISVIVLVGVVVNNGIVLIDCAHRLIHDGKERTAALIEAGRTRFRPILMTAATTVVGLLPMALSDGGGSQISYIALSRALIGGLIVSTFFTLFFVPILYTLFDDLRRRAADAMRALLSQRGPGAVATPFPGGQD
ncbi:MAG: hypothetical protein CMJ83_14885 [Planctomycetes bacterium]|nr:hypothetical protein [Planctomycetota bacterium]